MSTLSDTATCRLTPTGDRLIAEIVKTPDRVGSIFIPENAEKLTQEAIVISCSVDFNPPIPIGTRIIFEKYAGTSVSLNGRDYLFLNKNEIYATLED